jgi:hypothetical protein
MQNNAQNATAKEHHRANIPTRSLKDGMDSPPFELAASAG